MRRRVLLGFLGALVGLFSACQAEPSATPQPSPMPTPTRVRSTPTPLPFEMYCTLISQAPDSNGTPESLFPVPTVEDWSAGAATAAFTLIEYADLHDPLAADLEPIFAKLRADYPTSFRLVFRALPDAENASSMLAAQAMEAAGLQGQFWPLHDILLSQQAEWRDLPQAELETWLQDRAKEIGLDGDRFAADLKSEPILQKIQQGLEQDTALGIHGPMLLLANGQIYQGAADYTSLESLLLLFDLQARQYHACPPTVIEPHTIYLAVLETEKGRVVVELYPDRAPLAVNSFVFLAQNGWYDNTTFHRVLPGVLVQGGDPSGTGYGNAGYAFANEFIPDLTFNEPGMIAMADGSDSNSSQFFINLSAQPDWNGRYTIFGRVLEGMDVLESLTPRDPSSELNPTGGDHLIRITIQQGN